MVTRLDDSACASTPTGLWWSELEIWQWIDRENTVDLRLFADWVITRIRKLERDQRYQEHGVIWIESVIGVDYTRLMAQDSPIKIVMTISIRPIRSVDPILLQIATMSDVGHISRYAYSKRSTSDKRSWHIDRHSHRSWHWVGYH